MTDDDTPTVLDGPLRGVVLGPKLAALDKRRQIFAFTYGSGIAQSAREAARLAGYSDPALSATGKPSNSLGSRAHQLLHEPAIIEAIEEVAAREFRNLIPLIIGGAKQILLDPKHRDYAKTVLSLLARLGYAEKTSVDVNVSGEVTVNHTDAAVEDLRRLKELGVSRERLLESFGAIGLDRYERLLAERTPKLIEGSAVEVKGAVEAPLNPMADSFHDD
jgi:hypothetical protein